MARNADRSLADSMRMVAVPTHHCSSDSLRPMSVTLPHGMNSAWRLTTPVTRSTRRSVMTYRVNHALEPSTARYAPAPRTSRAPSATDQAWAMESRTTSTTPTTTRMTDLVQQPGPG